MLNLSDSVFIKALYFFEVLESLYIGKHIYVAVFSEIKYILLSSESLVYSNFGRCKCR